MLDADGKKVKGILKAVEGNDFTVGVEEKVKVEGKKRPVKHLFYDASPNCAVWSRPSACAAYRPVCLHPTLVHL